MYRRLSQDKYYDLVMECCELDLRMLQYDNRKVVLWGYENSALSPTSARRFSKKRTSISKSLVKSRIQAFKWNGRTRVQGHKFERKQV